MKININVDSAYAETEITINCAVLNDELENIIATLRTLDNKLTGVKNGRTYILNSAEILYIDTVDKKTFLYGSRDVYETSLKLYELEELLSVNDFFRAGKSIIINFNKIKSLKSDIDGRFIVMMENGEKLIVSKQYAPFIKNKLGRA